MSNKQYTFMALAPFTTMEKGVKRSFSAGDSFQVKGESTALHYIGETSPYIDKVMVIEIVGQDEVKENKAETFFKKTEKMNEPTSAAKEVKEVASEIEVQPSGQKLVATQVETPKLTAAEASIEVQEEMKAPEKISRRRKQ